MNSRIRPIYLFADSELLFWRQRGRLFLQTLTDSVGPRPLRAAYVGAAEGENPVHYSIFEAALGNVCACDCRLITSRPSLADLNFIRQAGLIALASRDVGEGYRSLERNGLNRQLVRRYHEGALLIGLSAGAVQLGLCGWVDDGPCEYLIDTLKLVPLIVGVDEEDSGWERLHRAVLSAPGAAKGIGIPAGGGLCYHASRTVEPIRLPLHDFSLVDDTISHSLLPSFAAVDLEEACWVC
jgi:hypothetical protein